MDPYRKLPLLDKGNCAISSSNLTEVKANEVFIAQQVLPPNRHRKLVSIAQGFDGIRTRLGVILQSLPYAGQDDVFQTQHLAHQDEEVKKRNTSNVIGTATGRASQLLSTVHMNEAKVTFHPEAQAAYDGSSTATVTPQRLRRTARLKSGIGGPTAGQILGFNASRYTQVRPADFAQHRRS